MQKIKAKILLINDSVMKIEVDKGIVQIKVYEGAKCMYIKNLSFKELGIGELENEKAH